MISSLIDSNGILLALGEATLHFLWQGLAIWAAWKMFQTTDPVMTIRWGVGVVVAVNVGLFMKGGLGLQMQNNRILRELKRVELQLARGQARESV